MKMLMFKNQQLAEELRAAGFPVMQAQNVHGVPYWSIPASAEIKDAMKGRFAEYSNEFLITDRVCF